MVVAFLRKDTVPNIPAHGYHGISNPRRLWHRDSRPETPGSVFRQKSRLVRSRKGESTIVFMTDPENAERHLAAILRLPEDEQLLAFARGHTNPNLDPYDPIVKAAIESRLLGRIANETKELARITEESRTQVTRLVDSSKSIEMLTTKLNRLTWTLIVMTGVMLVIGAAQTWKLFMPEAPTSRIQRS